MYAMAYAVASGRAGEARWYGVTRAASSWHARRRMALATWIGRARVAVSSRGRHLDHHAVELALEHTDPVGSAECTLDGGLRGLLRGSEAFKLHLHSLHLVLSANAAGYAVQAGGSGGRQACLRGLKGADLRREALEGIADLQLVRRLALVQLVEIVAHGELARLVHLQDALDLVEGEVDLLQLDVKV